MGRVHMLLGQDIKVEYTVTTLKDSGHKELKKVRTTPTAQTFEQDAAISDGKDSR